MNKYISVSTLTRYIKHKIDTDENLKTVYLKGEISNFKRHSSGHLYFSIKDEESVIKAIMFKSSALKLDFNPKEGDKVLVTGSISVYEAGGTYQIYVSHMSMDGIGDLYQKYELLKKKLEKEGLFDKKYKKEIPKFPKRIGIVTASTGAAIKDILSTIERRYPICETYLFPCLVQGENAPSDIVSKMKKADTYHLDVIIVGRGGGSFEDLNCFNAEEVARCAFSLNTPVISAVGHEVDFTILDFVSDLRAPTPTGAAEMAVPNMVDLSNLLKQYHIRMAEAVLKKIKYLNLQMDSMKNSFVLKNPNLMFENKRQTLDIKTDKLKEIVTAKVRVFIHELDMIKTSYIIKNPTLMIEKEKQNMKTIVSKLELLNPLSILKRGYSVTYKDGKVIKKISEVKKDDMLSIRVEKGYIKAKVWEVTHE